MEHEHHQEVKKAHLKAARDIMVDGAQEEDQKQSCAAWRHIMEAMKQQKMTDRIDRRDARVKKKARKARTGIQVTVKMTQKRTDHHQVEITHQRYQL